MSGVVVRAVTIHYTSSNKELQAPVWVLKIGTFGFGLFFWCKSESRIHCVVFEWKLLNLMLFVLNIVHAVDYCKLNAMKLENKTYYIIKKFENEIEKKWLNEKVTHKSLNIIYRLFDI